MITSATLTAWLSGGPGEWAATVQRASDLGEMSWLWADLGGLQHAGSLPEAAPITGCIWGWADQRWVRLRVDYPIGGAARVYGAMLTADPNAGAAGEGAGTRVQVRDTRTDAFRSSHSRGPGLSALKGHQVRCLSVPARSLTFVELVPQR